MLDLVISGGIAVMPGGTAAVDIGVEREKIVAIGAPGSLGAASTGWVIDATDQIVIPGGVDPHTHCLSPIPFPGRNEEMLTAPPDQVSRAALFGGTTTMLDFIDCPPEIALLQSIKARGASGRGSAIAIMDCICSCAASRRWSISALCPGRSRRATPRSR